MTSAAHAVYAPSSAHRWSVCTASADAIAQLDEEESGEEAEQGTAAHDEIERLLGHLNGRDMAAEIRAGKIGALLAFPSVLNLEHPAAYGVALVISFVSQLPPGRLWIEQRVQLTPEIWGRCDVAHWDDAASVLTIVDYKNGFVDVQAEDNEQLLIYAAASIYTHKLPAKWIRLVVVQPNSFMPVPRVKQWVTDAASLHAFASKVAAIPQGPKEFRAGEVCKYCPMFGRCPASQDVLVRLSAALCNAPAEVPAAQVALFKALEKPVSDWFEALHKAKTKEALQGRVPPGMKLVTTQTKRTWKDEAAARTLILERFGVDALDPPTPAQAEKLGLDVTELAAAPPGGPALAFESDRRPEWRQKSAAEMFSAAAAALGVGAK